jgi:tetratricopeptide (TPR) repeat protein
MPLAVFANRTEYACALEALERRDFERAEREFDALLARDGLSSSDRAFVQNKRGVARIGLQQPDAARADFVAALALHPQHAPALTNLGNLLLESGDVDGAIAYYERAIAADAEYAVAYLNLGKAYKKAGRIAEGVRALRRAQRLDWRARAAFFSGLGRSRPSRSS